MRVIGNVRLRAAIAAVVVAGCGSSPVAPPIARSPLVYVAIGASDAVGIGAFPPTEGYVYQLTTLMGTVRDPVTLRNLGINGARVDEMVAEELQPAIDAQPDVVTIWTGSNDVIAGVSVSDFRRDLDALLSALRARTTARVFVGDLADLTRVPLFIAFPDSDVTTERMAAFNREIEQAVATHGANVVRVSAISLDSAMFSIDGFHPSNEGHRRLAAAFFEAVRPVL